MEIIIIISEYTYKHAICAHVFQDCWIIYTNTNLVPRLHNTLVKYLRSVMCYYFFEIFAHSVFMHEIIIICTSAHALIHNLKPADIRTSANVHSFAGNSEQIHTKKLQGES